MKPGTEIEFGKYRLIEKIGQGGMAEVFFALSVGLEGFAREVALKVVLPELCEDPEFVKSFIDEARLGGLLNHHHIVQTLDFGNQKGRYFLAMEYVHGLTLRDILNFHARRKTAIPPAVVLDLIIQLCDGLHYAHEAEDEEGHPLLMVHRDLKPTNILVNVHGVLKIADFGIARAETNLRRTVQGGMLKGTAQYMSPEQALGAHRIDQRSDIFSVASIAYELICLKPLFHDPTSSVRTLRNVQEARVDGALDEMVRRHPYAKSLLPVFRRMLARNPGDRPMSIVEILPTLRTVQTSISRITNVQGWMKDVVRMLGRPVKRRRPSRLDVPISPDDRKAEEGDEKEEAEGVSPPLPVPVQETEASGSKDQEGSVQTLPRQQQPRPDGQSDPTPPPSTHVSTVDEWADEQDDSNEDEHRGPSARTVTDALPYQSHGEGASGGHNPSAPPPRPPSQRTHLKPSEGTPRSLPDTSEIRRADRERVPEPSSRGAGKETLGSTGTEPLAEARMAGLSSETPIPPPPDIASGMVSSQEHRPGALLDDELPIYPPEENDVSSYVAPEPLETVPERSLPSADRDPSSPWQRGGEDVGEESSNGAGAARLLRNDAGVLPDTDVSLEIERAGGSNSSKTSGHPRGEHPAKPKSRLWLWALVAFMGPVLLASLTRLNDLATRMAVPGLSVDLRLESIPEGALVTLDGRRDPLGKTPLVIQVPVWKDCVEVTLQRMGYSKLHDCFPISEKGKPDPVRLEPLPGTMSVVFSFPSDLDMLIQIDGWQTGTDFATSMNESRNQLRLYVPLGHHNVQVTAPGCEPATLEVDFDPSRRDGYEYWQVEREPERPCRLVIDRRDL